MKELARTKHRQRGLLAMGDLIVFGGMANDKCLLVSFTVVSDYLSIYIYIYIERERERERER